MKNYNLAMNEYEDRLFNPYDHQEDEEERMSDEEAYWAMVDAQVEARQLGEDW